MILKNNLTKILMHNQNISLKIDIYHSIKFHTK